MNKSFSDMIEINGYCGVGLKGDKLKQLNQIKEETARAMADIQDTKDIQEIAQIIRTSLEKEKIKYTMCVAFGDTQLKELQTWIRDNKEHIIFLAFTESGHVAVVGKGNDLRFPKIKKNASNETTRLLFKTKQKWDKNRSIVIYIKELNENGEGVLKRIKGIETYIGEELLENEVPIINAYSHRNWKMEYWNKWKENKYKYIK